MHTILEFTGNVSHPPAPSAASRKKTAPEPSPRVGSRKINGRPIIFSTETEGKRARKAEETTGLVAREVFRPARKRSGVPELFPDDPQMRCQLGKIEEVEVHQPDVPNICWEFHGTVGVFALKAWGRTWPAASAMAVRLGYTATEVRP